MGVTVTPPLRTAGPVSQSGPDTASREQIQQLEQHIALLREHLAILRQLNTSPRVIEMVEHTLSDAEEQLRRITNP
jgi:hypothetical protein